MSNRKEIEQFVRELRRQGFDVAHTKNSHYKIRHEGRVIATLPSTPSGSGRAINSIIHRELPKLRACGFAYDRRV